MHKRPIDARHALEHVLQTLAQIVAVAQAHALVEHDVDLDVELVANVVGLQALDGADGLGEAHGQVEEDVALVGASDEAGQVPYVLARRTAPVEDDVEGEQEPAEGVEPPDLGVVADWRRECVLVRGPFGHGIGGKMTRV